MRTCVQLHGWAPGIFRHQKKHRNVQAVMRVWPVRRWKADGEDDDVLAHVCAVADLHLRSHHLCKGKLFNGSGGFSHANDYEEASTADFSFSLLCCEFQDHHRDSWYSCTVSLLAWHANSK